MIDRYVIFLELLIKYNSETNKNKKQELAKDLTMLKSGLIPVKYIRK